MIGSVILIFSILIILSACQKASPITECEKMVVENLTSKMRTHCVGRYILELPRELLVKGSVKVSDVHISSAPENDLRSFQAMVVRREFRLRETKSQDEYPFLYEEGKGRSENTRYFISRERTDKDPNFRKIEAYKWDGGYSIKLEIDANDFTYPDQTSDKVVRKIGITNDVPVKLARVLDLLDRVRGRSEEEIPSEPGLCFFGGFVKGKVVETLETERVRYAYAILQNPDAVFNISSYTDLQLDTTLLQRSKMGGQALQDLNVKTIRSGVVNMPNLIAEEWLMSSDTILGTPGHHLTLEANSQISSIRTPLVILDLNTGIMNMALETPPASSSLNDNEVVALWDAVSRTLRVRPNGF